MEDEKVTNNLANDHFMEIYYNVEKSLVDFKENYKKEEPESDLKQEKIHKEKEIEKIIKKMKKKERNLNYKKIKGLDHKLMEMYVSETDVVLQQFFDKELGEAKYYTNILERKRVKSYFLYENLIKKHILFEETIGTFANVKYDYTKFITFDVDSKEPTYINTLIEVLNTIGIREENILVSSSGNKGYHVDLFFEKVNNKYPSVNTVQNFYYKVIGEVQNIIIEKNINLLISPLDKKIEFRPTSVQGCKLPCGKHKETGNFCNLFENSDRKVKVTLSDSLDRLNKVVPININDFVRWINNRNITELKLDINNSYIRSIRKKRNFDFDILFEKYKEEFKLDIVDKDVVTAHFLNKIYKYPLFKYETKTLVDFIGKGYLKYDNIGEKEFDVLSVDTIEAIKHKKITKKGTRHDITTELLYYYCVCKSKTKEESIINTKEIILNSSDIVGNKMDKALKEVDRLSNYIQNNGNVLFGNDYTLKLCEDEIEETMTLLRNKKISLSQVYLLLALKKAGKLHGRYNDLECSATYLLILSGNINKKTKFSVLKLLKSFKENDIIRINNQNTKKTRLVDGKYKTDSNILDLNVLNKDDCGCTEYERFNIETTEDFIKHIAKTYTREELLETFSLSTYGRHIRKYFNESI